MWVLAIIMYTFLAIYEFIPMYKQKLWHEFWINAVLWGLSFTMAILLCLEVEVPSPEKPIRQLITSIFGK